MDQLELFDLPNPCIGVCQSNSRGYCIGCLRSREERFNWHGKPVAERAHILKLLTQRRARLTAKTKKDNDSPQSGESLELF
ncbi:MAG: DUF1289 domain-containing protein [Gammaproteobacteria bacterium]|nr:DUF1289 domain-containing protein [Gammaproteobacteria bacterium]MBU1553602.1 DUF1289 domain-containing protein [Gammaproteobacteria bacterium]MBU2070574.1 DUF1289 domain-containing protein [Gammaproteobacteria bacterium]MBU2182004.1 DUF1289 domain-containing protein [Gammaproteobacteria bacterium]MBU2207080.1 DUF1289 domain-containing protein [Gammaproteobacteria bacterium]